MACEGRAAAAGWEMRDFETPDGDPGHALVVSAARVPGVRLAIGCDGQTGSRWRGLAIVEDADRRAGFGMRGDVRIKLGENWTRDMWAVRTTATERRVFASPEPTRLTRRLLRAEAAAKDATVTIEIHGVGGKPIPVTFPLAGLGAKIETLEKRCDDWDLRE
jgi:hypothetical protein